MELILKLEIDSFAKVAFSPKLVVSSIPTYFALSSFLLIFIHNMIGLRMRLELINEAVKSSSKSSLSSLHIHFCESIQLYNKIFPFALSTYINFGIISFVFSLYEIYFAIMGGAKNEEQLALCIMTNLWNLLVASTIIIFIYFGVCVKSEGENTFRNLIDKCVKSRNKKIWMFVLQTGHLKHHIGSEMLVVEWKLLLKVNQSPKEVKIIL